MEILLMLLLLLVWLLFLFGFGVLFFNFILFMAHEGYLHAVKALSVYVNSSSNWSWLEQMLFALCINELITLFVGNGMVAVPLQILVGVSGFSVYGG